MVVVLQEVMIADPQERLKSKTIRYKTRMVVDRAYLESVVPFMVSFPTFYITLNPP
jgi:hypothetical protein